MLKRQRNRYIRLIHISQVKKQRTNITPVNDPQRRIHTNCGTGSRRTTIKNRIRQIEGLIDRIRRLGVALEILDLIAGSHLLIGLAHKPPLKPPHGGYGRISRHDLNAQLFPIKNDSGLPLVSLISHQPCLGDCPPGRRRERRRQAISWNPTATTIQNCRAGPGTRCRRRLTNAGSRTQHQYSQPSHRKLDTNPLRGITGIIPTLTCNNTRAILPNLTILQVKV